MVPILQQNNGNLVIVTSPIISRSVTYSYAQWATEKQLLMC